MKKTHIMAVLLIAFFYVGFGVYGVVVLAIIAWLTPKNTGTNLKKVFKPSQASIRKPKKRSR